MRAGRALGPASPCGCGGTDENLPPAGVSFALLEHFEHQNVSPFTASVQRIVDVGANSGKDFSLPGMRAGRNVIAFEALPKTAALLGKRAREVCSSLSSPRASRMGHAWQMIGPRRGRWPLWRAA